MIQKEMLIEDLVQKHPELIGPLKDEGIVCLACGEPVWGTLEEQASQKGIKDISGLVERMNDRLKKPEKDNR